MEANTGTLRLLACTKTYRYVHKAFCKHGGVLYRPALLFLSAPFSVCRLLTPAYDEALAIYAAEEEEEPATGRNLRAIPHSFSESLSLSPERECNKAPSPI